VSARWTIASRSEIDNKIIVLCHVNVCELKEERHKMKQYRTTCGFTHHAEEYYIYTTSNSIVKSRMYEIRIMQVVALLVSLEY